MEKKRENRPLPRLFVSYSVLLMEEEANHYLSNSIAVRRVIAVLSIHVASFPGRDTDRVGMSLELGRLFHLWGRRAVVSVGVCMVIDLQLIPRSNPKLVPRKNPTKSPDKDRHRSFISIRCSRCSSWAPDGVGVTREDVHVQGCWYIGPLCRLGSDGHADLVSISWGCDTYGLPSSTRLADYPSARQNNDGGLLCHEPFPAVPDTSSSSFENMDVRTV